MRGSPGRRYCRALLLYSCRRMCSILQSATVSIKGTTPMHARTYAANGVFAVALACQCALWIYSTASFSYHMQH